jgi:hypothetical protein
MKSKTKSQKEPEKSFTDAAQVSAYFFRHDRSPKNPKRGREFGTEVAERAFAKIVESLQP